MGKNKPLLWTAVLSAVGTTSAFAQITGTPAAGEYYFKDVATGKFLGQGNKYDTQASLNHGLLFNVTVDGGKYTLDSKVKNGNHFLGNGGFIDAPAYGFEITELKDKPGHYVIKAGDKYLVTDGNVVTVDGTDAAKAAVWQILPVKDMTKVFADASFEHPADATFFIKNANFSRFDDLASVKQVWNVEAGHFDIGYKRWEGSGQKDYSGTASSNLAAESYHSTLKASQKLTVPNGLYRLKVQGFNRFEGGTNSAKLFANDMEANFPAIDREADKNALNNSLPNSLKDAGDVFSKGLYWSDPVYAYVSDGNLEVGVKIENNGLWVAFDNFSLEYIGDVDVDGVRAELTQKLAVVINKANKYTDDNRLQELALKASQLQTRINKLTTDNKEAYAEVGDYKSGKTGNIGEEIEKLSADIEAANANYEAYVAAKEKFAELDAAGKDLTKTYEEKTFDGQPEETKKAAKETYDGAMAEIEAFKDAVEKAHDDGIAADLYSEDKLKVAVERLIGTEGIVTKAKYVIANGGTNDFSYVNVYAQVTASTNKYNAILASLNKKLAGAEDGDIYADIYVKALAEMNTQKRIVDGVKADNEELYGNNGCNDETQADFYAKLDAANNEMDAIYAKYIKYATDLRANYKAACADVEGITAKLTSDVKNVYTVTKPGADPTVITTVRDFYAQEVEAIETSIAALQANVDAANKAHTIAGEAPYCEKYNEDKAAIVKSISELNVKVVKSMAEYNANEASKAAIAALQTAFNNNKNGVKDGFAGVDNLTSDDKAYTTKGRFAKSEAKIQTAIDALTAAAAEAYKVDGTGKAGEFLNNIANDVKIDDKNTRLGTTAIDKLISDYKSNAETALSNYNRVAAELVKYDQALNGYDIPAQGKEGEAGYVPAKHVDGLKDVAKNTEVTTDGTYGGTTYAKAISDIEGKIKGVSGALEAAKGKEDVEHKNAMAAVKTEDGLVAEIETLSANYAANEKAWNKEQLAAAKTRMLEQANKSVEAVSGDLDKGDYSKDVYGKKADDLNKTKKKIADALAELKNRITEAQNSTDDAKAIELLATINDELNGDKGLKEKATTLKDDAGNAMKEYTAEKEAKNALTGEIIKLNASLNGGEIDGKKYLGVAATADTDLFTEEINTVQKAINAISADVTTSFNAETVRADRNDVKNDKGEVTKAGFNSRIATATAQIENLLTLAKNEADNNNAYVVFSESMTDAKIEDAAAEAKTELKKDEVATGDGRAYYLGKLAEYETEYAKLQKESATALAAKAKSDLDGAIKDNAKYTDTKNNMTALKTGFDARLTAVKANINALVGLAKANEAEHNAQVEAIKGKKNSEDKYEGGLQNAWDAAFATVTGAPASSAHEEAIKKLNAIQKDIDALSKAVEKSFGEGTSVTDKVANDSKANEITIAIKKIADSWSENYNEAVANDNKLRYEDYTAAYQTLVKTYQDETALVTKMSKLSYASGENASDVLIEITGKDGIYSKIDAIRTLNSKANETYNKTVSPTLWDAEEEYKTEAEALKKEIENLSKQYTDEVNRVAKQTYSREYRSVKSAYDNAVSDMQNVLHIDEETAKSYLDDVNTIMVEAVAKEEAKDFAYVLDETILPAFKTVADKIAADKANAAESEWVSTYKSAKDLAEAEQAKIEGFGIDERDERSWSEGYAQFVEETVVAAAEAWSEIEGDKYANYETAYSVLNGFISTLEEKKVGEKKVDDKTVAITETHTAKYWAAYDEEQEYQFNNDKVNAMNADVDELQRKLDAAAAYAGSLIVENKMSAEIADVQEWEVDWLRNQVSPSYSQSEFDRWKESAERRIANLYGKTIEDETGAIGIEIGGLRMDYENAAAACINDEEQLKKLDAYKAKIEKYVSDNDSIYKAYTVGIIVGLDKDGKVVYKKDKDGNIIKSTNDEVHAAYLALEKAIGADKSELTAIYDAKATEQAVAAINAAITETEEWIAGLQSKLDECDAPVVEDENKDALQKSVDDAKAAVQVVKDKLTAAEESNTVLLYQENIVKNAKDILDEALASKVEATNKKYVDNKTAYERLNGEIQSLRDNLKAVYDAADEYEYLYKGQYFITSGDETVTFDNYRDYQNYIIERQIANLASSVDGRYNDVTLNEWSVIYGKSDVEDYISAMEKRMAQYNQTKTTSAVSSTVSAAYSDYRNIRYNNANRFYPSEETANELNNTISDLGNKIDALNVYADNAYRSGSTTDLEGNEFGTNEDGSVIRKSYMELYPSIMAKAAELNAAADQLKKDVTDKSCMYGDANNDNKINVSDYNIVKNVIIGRTELEEGTPRFIAADVNKDDQVNIGDAVQIGNYIMTGNFSGHEYNDYYTSKRASLLAADDNNGVSLSTEGNGMRQTITVSVVDTKNFVAAQMNMVLPEGVKVVGEASEGHEVASNDVDGVHRIFVGGVENKLFDNNAVLTIEVEVTSDYKGGAVKLSDAVFSDVYGRTRALGGATIDGATGITELTFGEKVVSKVYSIGGQLMDGIKKGYNVIVNPDGTAKKVLKK